MQIFLVQAEHWEVPGISMHAYSDYDRASVKAAELVKVFTDELGLDHTNDWLLDLDRVQCLQEEAYLEIIPLELDR